MESTSGDEAAMCEDGAPMNGHAQQSPADAAGALLMISSLDDAHSAIGAVDALPPDADRDVLASLSLADTSAPASPSLALDKPASKARQLTRPLATVNGLKKPSSPPKASVPNLPAPLARTPLASRPPNHLPLPKAKPTSQAVGSNATASPKLSKKAQVVSPPSRLPVSPTSTASAEMRRRNQVKPVASNGQESGVATAKTVADSANAAATLPAPTAVKSKRPYGDKAAPTKPSNSATAATAKANSALAAPASRASQKVTPKAASAKQDVKVLKAADSVTTAKTSASTAVDRRPPDTPDPPSEIFKRPPTDDTLTTVSSYTAANVIESLSGDSAYTLGASVALTTNSITVVMDTNADASPVQLAKGQLWAGVPKREDIEDPMVISVDSMDDRACWAHAVDKPPTDANEPCGPSAGDLLVQPATLLSLSGASHTSSASIDSQPVAPLEERAAAPGLQTHPPVVDSAPVCSPSANPNPPPNSAADSRRNSASVARLTSTASAHPRLSNHRSAAASTPVADVASKAQTSKKPRLRLNSGSSPLSAASEPSAGVPAAISKSGVKMSAGRASTGRGSIAAATTELDDKNTLRAPRRRTLAEKNVKTGTWERRGSAASSASAEQWIAGSHGLDQSTSSSDLASLAAEKLKELEIAAARHQEAAWRASDAARRQAVEQERLRQMADALAIVAQQGWAHAAGRLAQGTELQHQLRRLEQLCAETQAANEALNGGLVEAQTRLQQLSELREQEMTALRRELVEQQNGLHADYKVRVERESSRLVEQHSEEVKTLRAYHERNLQETRAAAERQVAEERLAAQRAVEDVRQQRLQEISQLASLHEQQEAELRRQCEAQMAQLADKVELLRKECDVLRARSRDYEQSFHRDVESQVQLAIKPYMNFKKEVESLQAVLEMKTEQMQQLRATNNELLRRCEHVASYEERIRALEQERENLDAIIQLRTDQERQLSDKCRHLQKILDKEARENKRLSLDNEELMWRLSQSMDSSQLQETLAADGSPGLGDIAAVMSPRFPPKLAAAPASGSASAPASASVSTPRAAPRHAPALAPAPNSATPSTRSTRRSTSMQPAPEELPGSESDQ